MTDLILSAAASRSISEFQKIDTLMKAAQTRIATGLKVAKPVDNPAAYFDASSLRSRAAELNRVLDDVGGKLSTLQAADAALDSIISLVQTAQSDLATALASDAPHPTATGNVVVSTQTNVTDLAGVADSDQFSVQVGAAGAVTITVEDSDTPTTLLGKINAIANVSASYTTEGYLQIQATNDEDLILAEVTNTPLAGLGLTAATYDQSSQVSATRTTAATNFDAVLTQINQLAADATYKGVNLLLGDDLSITLNEDGSSTLTVSGVTFNSSGLSIDAAGNNFQLDTDIMSAQADLENALDTLRGFSSTLATNLAVVDTRSDFTSGVVQILNDGADSLTLADTNEESAALLSLQSRRDLATAGFSILQQSERSVLSLFA